jgi:D-tyrosyl-tRNA(Tyr) deacylase
VDGETIGEIGPGLLVLLGVGHGDQQQTAASLATRITGLRIFEDPEGKMNLSLKETGGAALCISQFTLYGDVRRGRRPSFTDAAPPNLARPLYNAFCLAIEAQGIRCEKGRFGEHMVVSLVNDGPVTLVIDSEDLERPRRG